MSKALHEEILRIAAEIAPTLDLLMQPIAGYGIRHGTFTTYLPTLKKLGVVIESGGTLTVHPSLLEGDAA